MGPDNKWSPLQVVVETHSNARGEEASKINQAMHVCNFSPKTVSLVFFLVLLN